MLNVNLQLEDSIVIGEVNQETNNWDGIIIDRLTEHAKAFTGWTGPQMASVSALSICGGELPPDLVAQLYTVAEPLLEGWPKELRPFP
jgi:hypothetical protein